jgi:methionyl-tRNA formyltransferase
VRTPLSLKGEAEQQAFTALQPHVAVVAAYGLILPRPILEAPRHGCLNVHASLLPRWRGAAPIQRAILAGDAMTGITIMRMEEGLDTGPMLAKLPTKVERKTAGELTDELAGMGGALMAEILDRFEAIGAMPQREESATYAPKIRKEEARLDFSRSATEVERQVRAFNPAPGAWIDISGERIKILKADVSESAGIPGTVLDERLTIACAEGAIVAELVQRAGKAPMSSAELVRGFPIPAGTKLE